MADQDDRTETGIWDISTLFAKSVDDDQPPAPPAEPDGGHAPAEAAPADSPAPDEPAGPAIGTGLEPPPAGEPAAPPAVPQPRPPAEPEADATEPPMPEPGTPEPPAPGSDQPVTPLRFGAVFARRRVRIAVAAAVVVAATIPAAILISRSVSPSGRHDTGTAAAGTVSTNAGQTGGGAEPTDAGAGSSEPAGTSAGSPVASPSASPTVISDAQLQAEALAQLRQLRDADLPGVTFDGQYVAQLASKSIGISDPLQIAANGTHRFYAADILAEHLKLRNGDNLGAPVVLLLSTDYGKRQLYHGNPLWVTFALGDFYSAADVQQWCEQRFPDLSGKYLSNQCAVRRLEPPRG